MLLLTTLVSNVCTRTSVSYPSRIGKYLSSFPILAGISQFCIISACKDWFESESRAPGALSTSGMSPLSVDSQRADERGKGPTHPASIAMASGAPQLLEEIRPAHGGLGRRDHPRKPLFRGRCQEALDRRR